MQKIILLLPILFLALTGFAQQNQNDSLQKANEQLQLQNDSLKKVQSQQQQVQPSSGNQPHNKKDTRPVFKRITFDISTSFWINTSETYFELSPMLTYHFPKMLGVGAGPTYLLRHDRNSNVNLNGWGGKVFARADLTKWLYAWTEYQGLKDQYIASIDPGTNQIEKDTRYVDSWFVSLGIHMRLGKRHAINAQALYDVLYNKNTSPYYSAWIYRVGFGF